MEDDFGWKATLDGRPDGKNRNCLEFTWLFIVLSPPLRTYLDFAPHHLTAHKLVSKYIQGVPENYLLSDVLTITFKPFIC